MTNQKRYLRQGGASAMGVLLIVAVLVTTVTLLLRLGPHYLDFQTMQTIVEDMPASEMNTMSIDAMRESFRKRFKVNSLRDFDLKKIIIIDRSKEGTVLTIEYEQREHLIANVDVVLSFYEQYRYQ